MRSNSTNSQVCLAFTVCCGLCPCKHRSCHSCWWKKAGPSHFVACNSFHQLQPDSGIAQVLFKIANLNFLQMPLLVFHTRVCNLIAFGMRCLLYYLFLINFFFEVGFHAVLVGSLTLYLRITLNFWSRASTSHSAGVTNVTLTVLLCSAGDFTEGLVHSSWATSRSTFVILYAYEHSVLLRHIFGMFIYWCVLRNA